VCAYSWRVPVTVGSGELRFVASQPLAASIAVEGRPVVLRWSWLDSASSLAPWALIAVLLVVPRENRRRQAWLILIPLALLIGLWDMPFRLLSVPVSSAEVFGFLVAALATGLGAVWLLGERIAAGSRTRTFLLALAVMLAAGGTAYVADYGPSVSDDTLPMLIVFGVLGLIVLAATSLAARCCGTRYRRGPFMAWLALWMPVVAAAILLCYVAVILLLVIRQGPGEFILALASVSVGALVVGGVSYLVNLPFMILAFKCPFYDDRFRKLYRLDNVLDAAMPPQPLVDEVISTEPTVRPVAPSDVVGAWHFYVDAISKTVTVDFRADGTFRQTIGANQGEAVVCPAGTWRLEGPLVHLSGYVNAGSGLVESRTWWMVDTRSGMALYAGNGSAVDASFRLRRAPAQGLRQTGPASAGVAEG
jgi:hypothetical protein